MPDKSKYFLYGETPVKFESTPAGGLRVLVFDGNTKMFFSDSTYWSQIMYDRDNLARRVDEMEFNHQVSQLSGAIAEGRPKVWRRSPATERYRLKWPQ